MRTCAAKVQLASECRISHSSQSTYFDAVALIAHSPDSGWAGADVIDHLAAATGPTTAQPIHDLVKR